MYKKIIFSLGLILGYSSLALAASTPLNLEGVYHCHGNDPTVTPSYYTTILTMTKQGNVYRMQEIARGNDHKPAAETTDNYNEFGILDGKLLSISFQYTNDTKVFGTTIMHVSHDGQTLDGYFYYWNQFNQKGTETCKKVST